jgi:hypothetical protein
MLHVTSRSLTCRIIYHSKAVRKANHQSLSHRPRLHTWFWWLATDQHCSLAVRLASIALIGGRQDRLTSHVGIARNLGFGDFIEYSIRDSTQPAPSCSCANNDACKTRPGTMRAQSLAAAAASSLLPALPWCISPHTRQNARSDRLGVTGTRIRAWTANACQKARIIGESVSHHTPARAPLARPGQLYMSSDHRLPLRSYSAGVAEQFASG